jgi:peptidoglycan hydrolase-like protein with peptidoglycan-binding domain
MVKLRLGSRGVSVKQWQLFLRSQGFDPGDINGLYDEATAMATSEFQKKNHIRQSGELDFVTYCQAVIFGLPPIIVADAPEVGAGCV